ncbi:lipopolysaccharide biosynthesis protein [Bittarella massiliensis (ex Durand et al. 2017)]|uniref:lipopolysaccharide biosynthesis protein n=1 Tax=Bittarella massiliensis (ex Durand et al. 2017) TaxID=1720313 RepID=UPI00073E8A38|nr:flippase [Bittarella massiliensis (ex Durand et al. 2017)]
MKKLNSKIAGAITNLSYTFVANIICTLISMAIVAVVPKALGTVEYGYWQLYGFYGSYIGFFHLGWADGIYLRYGGKEYQELDKKLFHSQFWLLFAFETLVAIGVAVFAVFFVEDSNKKVIFYMLALCCILQLPRGMLQYVLQGTNRIKEYAKNVLAEKLIYGVSVVVMVSLGVRDFRFLLLADLVAKLVTLVTICWSCRDIVISKAMDFAASIQEAWENINVGVKLMFANVASMLIIGIVRFAIERVWSVEIFGQVSLTLSISNMLMLFISAVSVVMFPLLKRTPQEKWADNYIFLRTTLVVPMLAILMAYYPAKVILSAWLPQYAESLSYMALMFPMCMYEGKMSMIISTYLKALRRENLMLAVNLISVCLSLLTTGIIVYSMKDLPLAVVSILGLLAFRSILAEVFLARILEIRVSTDILLEVAMTVIFIWSSWIVRGWAGVGIYLGAYVVYLFLKRKDITGTFRIVKETFRPSAAAE